MFDKLNASKFDSSWRKACNVKPCSAAYLRHMVKNHYLAKWPAIQALSLGMFCGPFVIGMVIFAEPPQQTIKRYGGPTWELARLWIQDDVPRNAETWLIAKAIKYIKQNYPLIEYLISYADPSVGHNGTIYRAANWMADGMTDDERKSPRCDYVDVHSGKKYSRQAHIPPDVKVKRVPRISKYRFLYHLKHSDGNG